MGAIDAVEERVPLHQKTFWKVKCSARARESESEADAPRSCEHSLDLGAERERAAPAIE